MSEGKLKPILKWPGGKRQLIQDIIPQIDRDKIYVEPFIGGGAILFELQPKMAIINDSNSELINVYLTIRDNPSELIGELIEHEKNNCSDYFYEIRSLDRLENYCNLSKVQKAARFIYLNKTCFNGLYRVNSKGYFNAPYGKYKNPNIANKSLILAISQYFNENNIDIRCGDYKEVLIDVDENCFVYMDPPYIPVSDTSSFTAYTKDGFSHEEQLLLKHECDKLSRKGIRFLQSNSDCPATRELYQDYIIYEILAKRSINCNGEKRGKIKELLIKN